MGMCSESRGVLLWVSERASITPNNPEELAPVYSELHMEQSPVHSPSFLQATCTFLSGSSPYLYNAAATRHPVKSANKLTLPISSTKAKAVAAAVVSPLFSSQESSSRPYS